MSVYEVTISYRVNEPDEEAAIRRAIEDGWVPVGVTPVARRIEEVER